MAMDPTQTGPITISPINNMDNYYANLAGLQMGAGQEALGIQESSDPFENFVNRGMQELPPTSGLGGAMANVDSKGYFSELWANLESPKKLMKEESLIADVSKFVARLVHGNPGEEMEEKIRSELQAEVDNFETNEITDNPRYRLAKMQLRQIMARKNKPTLGIGDTLGLVKDAFKQNPGKMTAEIFNVMIADPELLLTPIGWEVAALRVGKFLRSAGKITVIPGKVIKPTNIIKGKVIKGKTVKGVTTKGNIVKAVRPGETVLLPEPTIKLLEFGAGAAGTSLVGAGLMGMINSAEQAAEHGSIDLEELGASAGIGALGAAGLIAPFKAFPRAASIMRKTLVHSGLMPRPDNYAKSIGASAFRAGPLIKVGVAIQAASNWSATSMRNILGQAVYKSRSILKPLTQRSKHARAFVARMEHEEYMIDVHDLKYQEKHFGTTSDLYELKMKRADFFHARLAEIFETLNVQGLGRNMFLGFRRKLPQDVMEELWAAKTKGNYTGRVGPAARELERLTQDMAEYGIEVGLFKKPGTKGARPEPLKNYMARSYNKQLRNDIGVQEEFLNMLESKYGFSNEHSTQTLRNIVDRDGIVIDEVDMTPFMREGINPAEYSGTDYARRLAAVSDQDLAPFLERNVWEGLTKSIQALSARGEWTRLYGVRGEKFGKAMDQVQKETRITAAERKQLVNMAMAQQSSYGRFAQVEKGTISAGKINSFLLSAGYLITLPLATLSSIPEILVPFMRSGSGTAAFKAMAPVARDFARNLARTFTHKVSKGRTLRAAEDVGVAVDVANAERIHGLLGGEMSRISGGAQTVSNVFFKAIMLEQFTRWTRVFSFETGKNMIRGHLKYLAKNGIKGYKGEKYTNELVELGVEYKHILETAKQAKIAPEKLGIVFEDVVDRGALRFTNEVVMAPRVGNRPLWMSNPHWALVAQLKGFQMTFGNTVVKRMLKKSFGQNWKQATPEAIKTAIVGSIMMATAYQIDILRHLMRDGDLSNYDPDDVAKNMATAFDRTGFAGPLQIAYDATQAHKYGGSPWDALVGPIPSKGINLAVAGVSAVVNQDMDELHNDILKNIPILNIKRFREEFER